MMYFYRLFRIDASLLTLIIFQRTLQHFLYHIEMSPHVL